MWGNRWVLLHVERVQASGFPAATVHQNKTDQSEDWSVLFETIGEDGLTHIFF